METTGSREVHRNPWTRVREDVVRLPDGSSSVYGVVERPDHALVVPAQDDGFWLVEQYRHPIGRRSWEFPQDGWLPGHTGRRRTSPAPSWRRRPACAPVHCATWAGSTRPRA